MGCAVLIEKPCCPHSAPGSVTAGRGAASHHRSVASKLRDGGTNWRACEGTLAMVLLKAWMVSSVGSPMERTVRAAARALSVFQYLF